MLVVTNDDEVWLVEEMDETLVVVEGVPEVEAEVEAEADVEAEVVEAESEVAVHEAKSVRVGLRFVSMTVTI